MEPLLWSLVRNFRSIVDDTYIWYSSYCFTVCRTKVLVCIRRTLSDFPRVSEFPQTRVYTCESSLRCSFISQHSKVKTLTFSIMTCGPYSTLARHPMFGMKFHYPRAGRCPAKFGRNGAGRPFHRREQNLHVADLGDKVQLSIDIPGVQASGLDIEVDDRVLSISGSRSIHTGHGVRTVEYSRRFRLDETIDSERVAANLSDGVLVLTAPRIQKARPIKIPVTTTPASTIPRDDEVEEDDDVVLVDVQTAKVDEASGDKKPDEVEYPSEDALDEDGKKAVAK